MVKANEKCFIPGTVDWYSAELGHKYIAKSTHENSQ